MDKLPVFTTAYSFKSILTPKDVASISEKYEITKPFIVEDNMVSFFYFNRLLKNFIYAVKFFVCNDVKNNDGKSFHRLIIGAKNKEGYKKLLYIYSTANKHSFKNIPYLDISIINSLWSDDLFLAVPFYNSYLHRNNLYGEDFMCDIENFKPIYFIENNGLFFDEIILNYIKNLDVKTEKVQSVYYEKPEDFLAWQTYICIQNRNLITAPNIEHCRSNTFCIANCFK